MLSACSKFIQTLAQLVLRDGLPTEDAAKKASTPSSLSHLKTRGQILASRETVDVYIIPVPAKSSSEVIMALRNIVPHMELQHLRRLARLQYMPKQVLDKLPEITFPGDKPVLYLLMCTVEKATLPELEVLVRGTPVFSSGGPDGTPIEPQISVIPVPKYMPTSPEEADYLSDTYWPTVFKRGNPFGPHPTIVENAVANLTRVREYIQLARDAGQQAVAAGVGHHFGAVVVNPTSGKVIAVAGDARFHNRNGNDTECWSNPLDHCVMRLVSMVAQKRLIKEGTTEIVSRDNPLIPLIPLEEVYISGPDNTQAGPLSSHSSPALLPIDSTKTGTPQRERPPTSSSRGSSASGNAGPNSFSPGPRQQNDDWKDDVGSYLCHNLHVYLSHEPCTMCAMALLHSRVGAVVFEHPMGRVGALTADGFAQKDGVGHGLFWRPDLNWKFLCWQWRDRGVTEKDALCDLVAA